MPLRHSAGRIRSRPGFLSMHIGTGPLAQRPYHRMRQRDIATLDSGALPPTWLG